MSSTLKRGVDTEASWSCKKQVLEEDHAGGDAAAAREVQLERTLLQAGGRGGATAYHGSVPVIDMSQPACAEAMWTAACELGFFTVTNHGIPEAEIDAAFAASQGFFAQAREDKEAQCPFARHLNSGYEYMAQVRPSSGKPDQKESLQITARTSAMDGRWPATTGFEGVVRSFKEHAHSLATRILDLLEPKACPHLPKGSLSAAHSLWAQDGQCTTRMIHYPPMEYEVLPPGYWRAAPFQRPGNEGLECAANPRADGATGDKGWLKVDPIEGGIAVNIGDMLSRWSDDRLLSNLHRVRMPMQEECRPPRPRYSIAFFMQADKGAVIESKHGAITAGDYILGRIRSNYAPADDKKEKDGKK